MDLYGSFKVLDRFFCESIELAFPSTFSHVTKNLSRLLLNDTANPSKINFLHFFVTIGVPENYTKAIIIIWGWNTIEDEILWE
jgi:hypothetical protein